MMLQLYDKVNAFNNGLRTLMNCALYMVLPIRSEWRNAYNAGLENSRGQIVATAKLGDMSFLWSGHAEFGLRSHRMWDI